MSDTVYNVKQYVRFSADEFIAIIITAVCAAFALSMRELLFTDFGSVEGIQSLFVHFIFLLFIILVCVYLCKIVAIKLGMLIRYEAHIPGLIFGLVITVISAGFLPLFIPGGFTYEDHVRLRIGKWPGNARRSWETGLVTGSFPLAALLFVLVFSPLYLYSQLELYASLIVGCCLLAVYSLIPVPFWKSGGKEWWTHLRDCTFGLDVVYSSTFWYAVLVVMVVLFSTLSIVLTLVGVRVGIIIYIFTLLFSLLAAVIYSRFFKRSK